MPHCLQTDVCKCKPAGVGRGAGQVLRPAHAATRSGPASAWADSRAFAVRRAVLPRLASYTPRREVQGRTTALNEHGKSDRPAVPAKSPNNAEQPAAEGMEGRGLAKVRSREQHAPRTQRRTSVRSALERVRQAAKRDRKQRFTALLHHVYDLQALRVAYFGLKKEAAPGVDGRRRGGTTARRGGTTARRWRATSRTSPIGSNAERTGPSRFAGCSSPRPTGGRGRSA
jgi:hypothetical protein